MSTWEYGQPGTFFLIPAGIHDLQCPLRNVSDTDLPISSIVYPSPVPKYLSFHYIPQAVRWRNSLPGSQGESGKAVQLLYLLYLISHPVLTPRFQTLPDLFIILHSLPQILLQLLLWYLIPCSCFHPYLPYISTIFRHTIYFVITWLTSLN